MNVSKAIPSSSVRRNTLRLLFAVVLAVPVMAACMPEAMAQAGRNERAENARVQRDDSRRGDERRVSEPPRREPDSQADRIPRPRYDDVRRDGRAALSADERRELRREIEDASRDVYRQRR